jgi:hypothetical protein
MSSQNCVISTILFTVRSDPDEFRIVLPFLRVVVTLQTWARISQPFGLNLSLRQQLASSWGRNVLTVQPYEF